MKITFYSNFLNHHQLPLVQEFIKMGVDFTFVATESIPKERLKLGYEDMNKKYPFVLTTYDDKQNERRALKLCQESDLVILGSAPEKYVEHRMKDNLITFRYSERLHKQGAWRVLDPILFFKMLKNNLIYKNKELYLLSSSAYSAYDYSKYNLFNNKAYKWGYFPKAKEYDIDKLIDKKKKNKIKKILWCGRFIYWKHPEMMIELAKKLKELNYDFEIELIGTGNLVKKLEREIIKNELSNNIKLLGSLPHEEVREYMEKSNIFVFTSDQNEGWGAVLNEAMNSACAVVASSSIGSVPYLINNKKNGIIFESKNIDSLVKKVTYLLDNEELCYEYGKDAYFTMLNTWSPENASKRLIELYEYLSKEKKNKKFVSTLDKNLPCSEASKFSEKEFYKEIEKGEI